MEQTKVPLKILIDSKSKDEIVRYRSRCTREIFIKDDRWFPTQCYFIHNYYQIELVEFEDVQWIKVPKIPAFKFGKNGTWNEFCPGTFAGPGMFTLSLFSLLKWDEFEINYADYKTLRHSFAERPNLPYIPNLFPEDFEVFYNKQKFLSKILLEEYNSSYYNIYKFDNITSVNFTISIKVPNDKIDE